MSKQLNIKWKGNLEDDCSSLYDDFLLRAERVDNDEFGPVWWWAVNSADGKVQLDSSNNYDFVVRTSSDARHRAELVAKSLQMKYQAKQIPGKTNTRQNKYQAKQ